MGLREIIEVWNPWLSIGEVPSSFKGKSREITGEIKRWLKEKWIKVIVGPRRAGKTTVMYQLIDFIVNENGPEKAIYVNFEDPEIRERGFKAVYEEVKKIGGKGVYLFFDEIQALEGWEEHIKSIYDRRESTNIVISGSTLAMIGKEFQRKLAGRVISFRVFPFSLKEAMRIRGITKDPRDREALYGLIEELLTTGSYPEIFLEKDPLKKRRLLLEYYEGILSRDVAAAHGLELERVEEFALYLLRNISSKISVNKLAKTFKIAYLTAEKYLNAFKESMVFFDLKRFSFSLKEQLAFPRKIYTYDLGFRWAVGKGHGNDKGRLFEAFVGAELIKRGYKLSYWQGNKECDFIISKNGKPEKALQVSWEVKEDNERREKEGLKEAMKRLKIKEGELITRDRVDLLLNLLTKNEKVFK